MESTTQPAVSSHTALMEQPTSAPMIVPSEPIPIEEEPRVLEHIADREGKDGKGLTKKRGGEQDLCCVWDMTKPLNFSYACRPVQQGRHHVS